MLLDDTRYGCLVGELHGNWRLLQKRSVGSGGGGGGGGGAK